MSQFKVVEKIKKYYNEFPSAMEKMEKTKYDVDRVLDEMNDASFKIPSLLG